jgi:hypothetical protein
MFVLGIVRCYPDVHIVILCKLLHVVRLHLLYLSDHLSTHPAIATMQSRYGWIADRAAVLAVGVRERLF